MQMFHFGKAHAFILSEKSSIYFCFIQNKVKSLQIKVNNQIKRIFYKRCNRAFSRLVRPLQALLAASKIHSEYTMFKL